MSCKQSGVCVYVECRGGVVEGEELDQNLLPVFFLFFSLFSFYHAFIVFRYKMLCAGLAMERTKPINQNKATKRNLIPYPPR